MGFFQKAKTFTKTKVVPAVKSVCEGIGSALPWMITGMTIGAAWFGYAKSNTNERDIRELRADQDRLADVVNNNANVLKNHLAEAKELEEKNQELLDEALRTTEGVEPE